MTRKSTAWILFLCWLGLYGWSIYVTQTIEPTTDGVLFGSSRVTMFLLWQLAAAFVAIFLLFSAKAFSNGFMRFLWRVPLVLGFMLLIAVSGVVLTTDINQPQPIAVNSSGDAEASESSRSFDGSPSIADAERLQEKYKLRDR